MPLPKPPADAVPAGLTNPRDEHSFDVRFGTATVQAIPSATATHTSNGDETDYADMSASYTKCLKQINYGVVAPGAFALFRHALGTSDGVTPGTADFEAMGLLGGNRKLNGPLGAFASTLVGGESRQFGDDVVPAPPKLASPEYATELVELYWASLLRDVPFTQYETNAIAIAAAKELTQINASYAGPLDNKTVTPQNLFRGGFNGKKSAWFDGELVGPYISQFCITPTNLGAQRMDQKMQTLAPGVEYMTDLCEWQAVQNGVNPVPAIAVDASRRYLYNGRALGAFSHIDELYQAYLTAYLVMNTVGIGPNKSGPYAALKNQQAFGTFGGPDIAATLGAVARAAINAVWYQKWVVHLRHRPESGGGIVHLMKNPALPQTDGKVHSLALDSAAVYFSNLRNGTYLLSQAFPEGSPAHPAYPTGHGTVAGACITVLKFFFECDAPYPAPPLVPSCDGLTLEPYTGSDAGAMTVNGELHKVAHNISFGHGIHAGIHWRSDTDYSIRLGEEVALRFLQDQAHTYQEKVAVDLKKIDGSTVTITN